MEINKEAYRPPMRERVVARLRRDAETSARIGDRSVGNGAWRLASAAYSTARKLNTAARQVELNLTVSTECRELVKEAEEEER